MATKLNYICPALTEDSAAGERTVVDLACVNTEDRAAGASPVVGLVSVNTEDRAAGARIVQGLWWIWSV